MTPPARGRALAGGLQERVERRRNGLFGIALEPAARQSTRAARW